MKLQKAVEMYSTANFISKIGEVMARSYYDVMLKILGEYDYDMFVFEPEGEDIRVRAAGYSFSADELEENLIVSRFTPLLPITDTVWFKIDDYGDRFLGTFLMPEDY